VFVVSLPSRASALDYTTEILGKSRKSSGNLGNPREISEIPGADRRIAELRRAHGSLIGRRVPLPKLVRKG
jgi:hypothetical protein